MLYVGIDLHARSFSLAVVNEDCDVIFEQTLATSSANMRGAMEALEGGKRVVFEESDLASWAYRLLEPHVDELVVANPKENRWISGDEQIHDKRAARKLAQLLRGGFIRPVHHTSEAERQVFKELVLSYYDTRYDVARAKNKLKAKFRQHGVVCSGYAVYSAEDREEWLSRLELSGARFQARLLMEQIDHLAAQREQLREEIARRGRGYKVIGRFGKVPGMGLIRSATFFAIIDTPHRFAHKRKVWSYCGIGIAQPESSTKQGPPHLNRDHNRYLKEMAKGAVSSAIQGDNAFARQYRRLREEGLRSSMARLTVARAIVSTLYAMWRKDEPYRPRTPDSPGPWPAPAEGRGAR
jgi:transposase